jgi:Zn-dependent M28 family amino/carboxypeptidase
MNQMKKNATVLGIVILLALLAIQLTASLAWADSPTDSSALRAAVKGANIKAHLQNLQNIGSRVAGTSGYDQAAAYVTNQLVTAGYTVAKQPFTFAFFQELSPSVVAQVAPGSVTYGYDVDYYTMDYSGSGDVTAGVQAVDLLLPPTGGSTSGCEASDFAGFTAGKIALIQRGTCTFAQKAQNAQAAGASAVIIFNEGNSPDRVPLYYGTLGGTGFNIPVLAASYAFGTTLNGLIVQGLQLHIVASTLSENRSTYNLLADTASGRNDRLVVVGAHLDSVAAGPGVNDNGSGVAINLEIAVQMAKMGIKPTNKVRFAFFSAEEEGLLGSTYYVSQLTAQGVKNTSVMLDLDMVASPVYARFVYDGNGSSTGLAGPNGSGNVEKLYLDYFASQSLSTLPTAFDGRSDYGPFIDAGIPAGGLFGGAEGYDNCYHKACDTMANISDQALDEMSDASANETLQFAMTGSAVNGTGSSSSVPQGALPYKGPHYQK